MIDPLTEIEELVAFQGRGPGTDAERRAALHLADRLRSLGRRAEIEPTRVRPGYPLAHIVHALMGIGASVASVYSPAAAAVVAFAAAVSTFGDLTGSFFLVRLLTPVRASQNVVSRESGGKPGLLVLTAHYDAARSGLLFNRGILERTAAASKAVRHPLAPPGAFFWSIVVILACCLARLAGGGLALTVVQFVATLVLIVSVPLLADIALSDVVPGAGDNASGVTTVLRLAERFGGSLAHFDLMVLLPGAGEGFALGAREWMRRHRRELDPRSTVFLDVDMAGHGTPRFATRSGLVFPLALHPTLVSLCEELAPEHRARGITRRTAGSAGVARAAGFPAMSVGCMNAMDYVPTYHQQSDTPESLDPDALDRAYLFCCDLIQLIDAQVGPDLGRPAGDTVLSET